MLRFLRALSLLALALLALPISACTTTGSGDDDDDVILEEVHVGSLVITEVLAYSNATRPDFVEIVNVTDNDVDLRGCQVVDGGTAEHDFTITVPVDLAPGAVALLGAAAFLDGNEQVPVDVNWGSDVTMNHQDESESVALLCPDGAGSRQLVDAVSFDVWPDFTRGRSWQLTVAPDATANDDPANWCPAPAQDNTQFAFVDGTPDYGTPGTETICEQLGGPIPSVAGDVVFSEILIDDPDGLREWFELHNPGDGPVDVRTCVLNDLAVGGDGDPVTHTLDAELGDTVIPAGGQLLLSKTDLAITDDGSLLADYPYSSLGFNNSEPQRLWIECPVGKSLVTIDEIVFNWSDYGAVHKGRSLQVDPGSLDDEGNDDPDNYCLAADADLYYDETTADDPPVTTRAWGTPGEPNPPCPVPDPHPELGDLVITEILVRADTALGTNEEWFEVKNVSAARVGLDGCIVRNVNAGGDNDDEDIADPFGVSLDPGEYGVFVRSSAADSLACELPHVFQYGTSIGFNNDDDEHVQIVCPSPTGGTIVDSIQLEGGYDAGIPWQLKRSAETAVANDDPANWCREDSTAAWTWTCTVDEGTHYGTPGGPSTCN